MSKEEAEKILEEQFELLHKISETCEPEYLESITNVMLNIYTILYCCQSYQV